MLLWRQKKLELPLKKSNKLFSKFLVRSLFVHAVFCFLLLFVQQEYHMGLSLNVRSATNEVKVGLVTTVKTSGASQQKVASAVKKEQRGKKTQLVSSTKKKSVKSSKKTINSSGVVQKDKKLKEEKIKEVVPEEVKEKEILAVEKPVVELPIEKPSVNQVAVEEVGYKEFNLLQLEAQVQEAVQEAWSPPAGMPESAECIMKITIGWNGDVVESVVEKTSGILVYDITVEHALAKIKFPHATWGKTIVIAFKP